MARIRTIKPEFWTDETVTECSLTTRLLFIGIWNFADDNGNIERSSKQMKMKIFPADDVNTEKCVKELLAIGLLREYEKDGNKYLNIKGFLKHQVINKPSKIGHPKYEEIFRTTTPLPECPSTEGKGMEGKGIVRELKNKRIVDFEKFWDTFSYKQGKGGAEKSWMAIKGYSQETFERIIESARLEAERRPQLTALGRTPKMAQGWITERRWEDEPPNLFLPMSRNEMQDAKNRESLRQWAEGEI